MAHYLVQARPRTERLAELRSQLESGEIAQLRPFGDSLTRSLRDARITADGTAVWEEVCYCRPPLAQERAAVLDDYFDDLRTEVVDRREGWDRIEHLPGLWGTDAVEI